MVTPTAVSGSGSKSKSRSKSNFHSGGDSSSESSASSFSAADLDACVSTQLKRLIDCIRLLFELEAKRELPPGLDTVHQCSVESAPSQSTKIFLSTLGSPTLLFHLPFWPER